MTTPRPAKEFDVVVYGATGYTGRLVAEYLARRVAEGAAIRWAMAARSLEKLEAVRAEIDVPADTPLVVADSEDTGSLYALCGRASVVLTTVGPYQLYGSPLVAACADTGTDYVDLCGEVGWMRTMIDAHEARAKETGARIVLSCGFDSVPFDMGVYYLQQQAIARFGSPLTNVKGRVRVMKGGFSGGTAASFKATLAAAAKDPSLIAVLQSHFALTPGFEGAEQPPGTKPYGDTVLGHWVAPFIMAPINTRNVHRSNFLLGHPYGRDFTYEEMLVAGTGEQGAQMAKMIASVNPLAVKELKPGEGPSKEERETGRYDVLFVGTDVAGRELRVGVTGDKDPGYGSTSKMIAECALCLTAEAAGRAGGVMTTAPAFGQALIHRLVTHAGLTFAVED
jgi:short subunit dehydrogenase-like uncharacterized protein